MKMKRQMLCEFLKILEEDAIIDSCYFMEKENKLYVYSRGNEYGNEEAIYSFNENDELVDPRPEKLRKQIKGLKEQIKELENEINLLTNK